MTLVGFESLAADLFDPGIRGTVWTGIHTTIFGPEHALKPFGDVVTAVLASGHDCRYDGGCLVLIYGKQI